MTKQADVRTSRRIQFQQACDALTAALARQDSKAETPSMNVNAAIARVLAFDPTWTKTVLGPLAANALIAHDASTPPVSG